MIARDESIGAKVPQLANARNLRIHSFSTPGVYAYA